MLTNAAEFFLCLSLRGDPLAVDYETFRVDARIYTVDATLGEGSRMPRAKLRTREREVARVLRAVAKSGTPAQKVEIDPEAGKIIIILGAPAQPQANEWDEELNGAH